VAKVFRWETRILKKEGVRYATPRTALGIGLTKIRWFIGVVDLRPI